MKKVLKVSSYILFLLLLIIVVVFLVNRSSGASKSVLGYRTYIILSDSMKPEFKAGDLIFVKEVNTEDLLVNDIISYTSRDPLTFGDVITHQIVAISPDGKEFVTKGINSDSVDPYSVPEDLIIGEYKFKIPSVGYFFNFLQTNTGFILLFVFPLSLLILTEVVHLVRLIQKYKGVDANELIEKKDQELEEYKAKLEELNKKLEEKEILSSDKIDDSKD